MGSEITIYHVNDLRVMAKAFADGGLFGFKQESQVLSLMLVAQAENKHPATVAAEYDFIQGKAALKATAIVSRFQHAGGKIEFHEVSDAKCSATFAHPLHGSIDIEWDIARAQMAGLAGKENWKKYPRAMLRSRCVAEGVRTLLPECLNGFYAVEEVRDFDNPAEKDITPKQQYRKKVIESVQDKVPYVIENDSKDAQTYNVMDVKIHNSPLEVELLRALDDGIRMGAIKENAQAIVLQAYSVEAIGELTIKQATKVVDDINKKIEATVVKNEVEDSKEGE